MSVYSAESSAGTLSPEPYRIEDEFSQNSTGEIGILADDVFKDGWVIDEGDPGFLATAVHKADLDTRPQIDPRQRHEAPRILLGFIEQQRGILHEGDVLRFHKIGENNFFLELVAPVSAQNIRKTLVFYNPETSTFGTTPFKPDYLGGSRQGRVKLSDLPKLDEEDLETLDRALRQPGFTSAGGQKGYYVKRLIPINKAIFNHI